MSRTRREALDEFLAFVGERGDAVARDLAERVLLRVIEHIWLQRGAWSDFLLPAPHQLTLTVGERSYALPAWFGGIGPGRVVNATRGTEIRPTALADLQLVDPTVGTTLERSGPPQSYRLGGVWPVAAQPLAAGEALELLSSSASDTAVLVTLSGLDAAGAPQRQVVTLTGTSPVAAGTWARLDAVGKGYPDGVTPTTELTSSAGAVTLRVVATARVLGTWLSHESAAEYPLVTFSPVPSAADVVALPALRRPVRLLGDADMLPTDWWPAIFRGMVLSWRDNTGEIQAPPAMWPELLVLIEHENRKGPPLKTRPWSGR